MTVAKAFLTHGLFGGHGKWNILFKFMVRAVPPFPHDYTSPIHPAPWRRATPSSGNGPTMGTRIPTLSRPLSMVKTANLQILINTALAG